MRLSPCVLVQPDGWARGEREGCGEPCDVTSLSLSILGHSSTISRKILCNERKQTIGDSFRYGTQRGKEAT